MSNLTFVGRYRSACKWWFKLF